MPRESAARGFDPARLRDARHRAGLTQTQLAERTGTDTTTIAKYETGARTPYVERLATLAHALGVTPATLTTTPATTLAELRAQAGLSQHTAATRAGLIRTTYAAIERGETATLTPDLTTRLATALNVTPSHITTAHAQTRATHLANPE
jgi:transcriptional regulator with XRE-family HTH domain